LGKIQEHTHMYECSYEYYKIINILYVCAHSPICISILIKVIKVIKVK
jgi:hypothetical protein